MQVHTGMKRGRPQGGRKAKRVKRGEQIVAVVPRRTLVLDTNLLMSDAKYFDKAGAVYACNTTGSITHLDVVPQGSTVNTRDGKAYKIRSVQVRGYFYADTTTTTTVAVAYMIWDRQPNKVLPAITDIFDSISSDSFAKRENKVRFVILKKWVKGIAGNITSPTTGKEIQPVEKWLRMPDGAVAQCTTADTTGVITNRINGALYLVTMGATAAGTADANVFLGFRINFSDL